MATYTTKEAKDEFSKLVAAAERGQEAVITRWQEPVAVVISYAAYQRMKRAVHETE